MRAGHNPIPTGDRGSRKKPQPAPGINKPITMTAANCHGPRSIATDGKDIMVAVSPMDTTALMLLQKSQLTDFRNPLAFLTSEHFMVIGAESLGATLLDTFSEELDLRTQYAETYDRLLKEHPGMTGANAAHNALVEVIMGNRDRFPPEGFAVHTQMPGGGSVTTFIEPASGGSSTAFYAMESAVKKAIAARIAETMALGETATVEPWSVQDLRDRVAALYQAP